LSHASVMYGRRMPLAQTRTASVRNETGWIVAWLGTSTDVHEMRELQEHQKVLVAELQHGNHLDVVLAMSRRRQAPERTCIPPGLASVTSCVAVQNLLSQLI